MRDAFPLTEFLTGHRNGIGLRYDPVDSGAIINCYSFES